MAIENMTKPTHYGSCAEELLELIDVIDIRMYRYVLIPVMQIWWV